MSKPYSIDPIAPDLLSLMTDSSGTVLPHAASVRDDTPAMGGEECLDNHHQQLPGPMVGPVPAQMQVDDHEATIRQRQKERRQQRQQSRLEQRQPYVSLSVPRALQSPSQMYLRVQQLAARWNVSVPTVWRWTADGKIPLPVRLSPGTTRWRLDEIEAYEQKLEEGK